MLIEKKKIHKVKFIEFLYRKKKDPNKEKKKNYLNYNKRKYFKSKQRKKKHFILIKIKVISSFVYFLYILKIEVDICI